MVGSAPRKVSQTAPLMKVSGLFRDRADGLTFTNRKLPAWDMNASAEHPV